MSRTVKFTGQLYQLSSRFQLSRGSYVAVNGPHDTFGVVQESTRKDDGSFLNLIRGVPGRDNEKPVASF